MSRTRFNFPLDLPENWQDVEYLSANGDAMEGDEKRGYNYLSKRINELANAINTLSSNAEDCVFVDQGSENPSKIIATDASGICRNYLIGRSLQIDHDNRIIQCEKLVKSIDASSGGILVTNNDGTTQQFITSLLTWAPKKAYVMGDIVQHPQLKSYEYLQCTLSGTSGDVFPSDAYSAKVGGPRIKDGTCQWRKKDWRCKHNTGDIVEKLGTPEHYEYLIELDGRGLDINTYYELTMYLMGGSGVILPDSRNRVTWHTDGTIKLGDLIDAGLPNITGKASGYEFTGGVNNAGQGCFYWDSTYSYAGNQDSSGRSGTLCFNASRSDKIYGNSTTVQPPAFAVKRYICFA